MPEKTAQTINLDEQFVFAWFDYFFELNFDVAFIRERSNFK